jgi:hypothetical protein
MMPHQLAMAIAAAAPVDVAAEMLRVHAPEARTNLAGLGSAERRDAQLRLIARCIDRGGALGDYAADAVTKAPDPLVERLMNVPTLPDQVQYAMVRRKTRIASRLAARTDLGPRTAARLATRTRSDTRHAWDRNQVNDPVVRARRNPQWYGFTEAPDRRGLDDAIVEAATTGTLSTRSRQLIGLMDPVDTDRRVLDALAVHARTRPEAHDTVVKELTRLPLRGDAARLFLGLVAEREPPGLTRWLRDGPLLRSGSVETFVVAETFAGLTSGPPRVWVDDDTVTDAFAVGATAPYAAAHPAISDRDLDVYLVGGHGAGAGANPNLRPDQARLLVDRVDPVQLLSAPLDVCDRVDLLARNQPLRGIVLAAPPDVTAPHGNPARTWWTVELVEAWLTRSAGTVPWFAVFDRFPELVDRYVHHIRPGDVAPSAVLDRVAQRVASLDPSAAAAAAQFGARWPGTWLELCATAEVVGEPAA